MARPRKPDSELTPQQLRRRRYNDAARGNSAVECGTSERLTLLPQLEKTLVQEKVKPEAPIQVSTASTQTMKPDEETRFPTTQTPSDTRSTQTNPAKITQTASRSSTPNRSTLLQYLDVALLGLMLVAAAFFSIDFQTQAFTQVLDIPKNAFLGEKTPLYLAIFNELVLVVLAIKAITAATPAARALCWALFAVGGIGSMSMMLVNQENTRVEMIGAISAEAEDSAVNSEVTKILRKKEALAVAHYEEAQKTLGTKRQGGWDTRDAEKALAEANNQQRFASDQLLKALQKGSTKAAAPVQATIVHSKVLMNEMYRAFLLIITAVFVHLLIGSIRVVQASTKTNNSLNP